LDWSLKIPQVDQKQHHWTETEPLNTELKTEHHWTQDPWAHKCVSTGVSVPPGFTHPVPLFDQSIPKMNENYSACQCSIEVFFPLETA
jgi:hypothetical protein